MGSAKTPENVSSDFSLAGKTTRQSLASSLIEISAWQDDLNGSFIAVRVLCLGLLQEGNVEIGVFPEAKKVLRRR
jgi:hypothetical protein